MGENSQANPKQKKSASNGQKALTNAGASALIVLEELTESKSPRQMSGLELNLFSVYLKKYQEAQSSSMEELLHDPLLPASIREQIYETLKQKEKDSAQDSAVYYKEQMDKEQLEAQRAYEKALQAYQRAVAEYNQALAKLSVAQQEHEQAVQELNTATAEHEVAIKDVAMAEKKEQSAQQNEQKERDKWVDNLESMYNSGNRQKAIELAGKSGVGKEFAKKVEGLSPAEKEILSTSRKQPLTPIDLKNLSPEEVASYKKLTNAQRTTKQASQNKDQAKQRKEKASQKMNQAEQKKRQTATNLYNAQEGLEIAQNKLDLSKKELKRSINQKLQADKEKKQATNPDTQIPLVYEQSSSSVNCSSTLAGSSQPVGDSSSSTSNIHVKDQNSK